MVLSCSDFSLLLSWLNVPNKVSILNREPVDEITPRIYGFYFISIINKSTFFPSYLISVSYQNNKYDVEHKNPPIGFVTY